jgi:hypothetical protein
MTIQVKTPRSTGWRIPVNGHIWTTWLNQPHREYKQICFATYNEFRMDSEYNNRYNDEDERNVHER